MERARVALSAFLVPIKIIASPHSSTCSIIKRAVGLIFIFSVHHLNAVLGTGYPFPITFTQNESSSLGVVFRTKIGKSSSLAFRSICSRTWSTYNAIIGFSTIVSLHTTYIGLRSWNGPGSSFNFLSAIHTSINSTVESFPPLKPIIQGRADSSAYAY